MDYSFKQLVMFDVSGIQDFIFSTPKLKEVIGASYLVEQVLNEMLESQIHLALDQTKDIIFDPVYVGGGNALYDLQGKDEARVDQFYKSFIKGFKIHVLNETSALSVISERITYCDSDDYLQKTRELRLKLSKAKHRAIRQTFFDGEPVMAVKPGTGSGVIAESTQNAKINIIKLDAFEHWKRAVGSSLHQLVDKLRKIGWLLHDEFDDFVEKGVDSYLGVVHIDGNNMGQMIRDLMLEKTKNKTFEEAKIFHGSLSQLITKTFEEVTIQGLYQLEEVKEIRPIVFAGDDITFVCKAKDAMAISKSILTAIANKSLEGTEMEGYKLSACAGIVYVKSHHPFHHAYELAESLCKSAKSSIRAHNNEHYKENPASALDYHIHYNGLTSDIERIREKEYPAYCKPQPLTLMGIGSQSALSDVEKTLTELKKSGMTRSKMKQLRSHLFINIESAMMYLHKESIKNNIDKKTLKKFLVESDQEIKVKGALAISCIELYEYINLGGQSETEI